MAYARPLTEQRIEKHLTKTGVKEVDEELLLASLCLTRIEKKYNQDFEKKHASEGNAAAAAASGHNKHYVESTIGSLVDATGRADMGIRPDELLHSRDAILHRTDVIVASGAIRRVAAAAATALHELDGCKAELSALRERCSEQQAEMDRQAKQLVFFRSHLAQLSTPEAIYKAFKSVWESEAAMGAATAQAQASEVSTNMSEMERHKATAALLSKEVIVRQQILDDTASKTHAIVGEIDVDKIEEMFQGGNNNGGQRNRGFYEDGTPMPTGVIDTAIDIMDMDEAGIGLKPQTHYNGIPIDQESGLLPATKKMLAEQARQSDYHVEQRVAKFTHNAITNSRQAAEAILECDQPVQFSRHTDTLHFVIRRTTADRGQRVIRMQGSSTSIVGKLTSSILYSPADRLQIEVDMKSTLGRKQQLQMQAEELHLTHVWNELCLYSRPYLNVVHFKINKSLEMQSKKMDFDVRPLVIDEASGVTTFEERKRQQEKRLAFKRLEEGIQSGRIDHPSGGGVGGGEDSSPSRASRHFLLGGVNSTNNYNNGSDERLEYTKQVPGIVRYIANKRGQAPIDEDTGEPLWFDPIENGSIRVAASSVMRPAELASIVKPFRDRHSNFFSTREEPGQYVEISFEQMSILPTGYSIACTHPINACHFPRSWRIDASADRVRWATLLRHVNDQSINRYAPTWAWTLPRDVQQSAFYSHFRIVSEGPNASGTDALCISSFEVYGKLVYITPDVGSTKMSDATIPNTRPAGFAPIPPLPVQKETKPAGKKAKKK